jgi:hypothetical protein
MAVWNVQVVVEKGGWSRTSSQGESRQATDRRVGVPQSLLITVT